MAIEDPFVEISGLLSCEPMQAEVVEDEQIGREEGPEGKVQRVVHSGLRYGLEEVVGVAEADSVYGADGEIVNCLGQEALADTGWSDREDMLALVQKLRRGNGAQ